MENDAKRFEQARIVHKQVAKPEWWDDLRDEIAIQIKAMPSEVETPVKYRVEVGGVPVRFTVEARTVRIAPAEKMPYEWRDGPLFRPLLVPRSWF